VEKNRQSLIENDQVQEEFERRRQHYNPGSGSEDEVEDGEQEAEDDAEYG